MKPADTIPEPFFIIGSPRSGTTYLQRVLNQHPELFITHETRVMSYVNRALNDLPTDDRSILARRDDWLGLMRREFPNLVYRFYRRIGAPKGARWGDKNPHYADPKIDPACLTTIDQIFPGSQFIHIVRDGRAVAASLLDKGWALNVEYAIDTWRRHILHARDFGEKIGPQRYLEVKHEDLVGDGHATVAQILTWLGVGDSPEVTAFLDEQARERTPISKPVSDLSKQDGPSWEGRLTPDALAVIEHGMADLLVALGYETQAWRDGLGPAPERPVVVASSVPAAEDAAPPPLDLESAEEEDLAGRVKLLTDLLEERNRQLGQTAQQLEAERKALETSRKAHEAAKARSEALREKIERIRSSANEMKGKPLVRAALKVDAALRRLKKR